ncbi:hypothetical protein BDZ89DRAFT_1038964 [Hymenopellis radicata]|nr:hypothetical protein BDZ89DRAFT_1038964 [Hymenopellis radicata]
MPWEDLSLETTKDVLGHPSALWQPLAHRPFPDDVFTTSTPVPRPLDAFHVSWLYSGSNSFFFLGVSTPSKLLLVWGKRPCMNRQLPKWPGMWDRLKLSKQPGPINQVVIKGVWASSDLPSHHHDGSRTVSNKPSLGHGHRTSPRYRDNDGKLNRSSPKVRRALGCLFCASSSSLPTPARDPGSTLTLTPAPSCLPPLNIPAIILVPLVPFKTPPIAPDVHCQAAPSERICSGYAEDVNNDLSVAYVSGSGSRCRGYKCWNVGNRDGFALRLAEDVLLLLRRLSVEKADGTWELADDSGIADEVGVGIVGRDPRYDDPELSIGMFAFAAQTSIGSIPVRAIIPLPHFATIVPRPRSYRSSH